ncbi:MAG: Holliday junction branch migration protein RuvA [Bacteroidales bacterium]|nr:Holliday junction branch migration protein RuvA [Bacteroidales bacterium]
MFEYISGNITEITPTYIIIDTGNIGYFVNISLQTHSKVSGKERFKIYIHQIIREDTNALYGFADKSERNIFRLLISVSGIGANTARIMLSSLSANEVKNAIRTDDVTTLQSVKGIGAKTAQRVIIDLKDKINKAETDDDSGIAFTNSIPEEALSALTMLGFPKTKAEKAVNKIYTSNSNITVEELVKNALKIL